MTDHEIIRCGGCDFFEESDFGCSCKNPRNANRGSGAEYPFEISFVGIDVGSLTKEEARNWFCGDAIPKRVV